MPKNYTKRISINKIRGEKGGFTVWKKEEESQRKRVRELYKYISKTYSTKLGNLNEWISWYIWPTKFKLKWNKYLNNPTNASEIEVVIKHLPTGGSTAGSTGSSFRWLGLSSQRSHGSSHLPVIPVPSTHTAAPISL